MKPLNLAVVKLGFSAALACLLTLSSWALTEIAKEDASLTLQAAKPRDAHDNMFIKYQLRYNCEDGACICDSAKEKNANSDMDNDDDSKSSRRHKLTPAERLGITIRLTA